MKRKDNSPSLLQWSILREAVWASLWKLDPRTQNGGVFLGLNGVVVKSHGGADAVGFASAVDMAIDMARADINARIKADRTAITAESAGARAAEL